MVNPFPNGKTQLRLSPDCNSARCLVPSPMAATSNQSSFRSLSKKLIDIGRRRKVVGELSTRTSTNCPGCISGKGLLSVNFIKTCLSLSDSTDKTFKSKIYFFIFQYLSVFICTRTYYILYKGTMA